MNAYTDYADWRVANEAECAYEPHSDELGNCPNCAEVIMRETLFRGTHIFYYWPCPSCGYTHHGSECPALD